MNHARQLRTVVLRAAYYLFLAIGIAGLTYASYSLADAHAYQAREENAFEQSRIQKGGQTEEPELVGNGEVLGEMEVPRLGLKVVVVQGDSARMLSRAVGHIPRDGFAGPIRQRRPRRPSRQLLSAATQYSVGRCHHIQDARCGVPVSGGIHRRRTA